METRKLKNRICRVNTCDEYMSILFISREFDSSTTVVLHSNKYNLLIFC